MGRVRYIIIGAGAVGGTIGGCLFQGGHDVVLVARGAHLDALRSRGLTQATPLGTETLDIPAVGGPGEMTLQDGDVLVLSTKGQDTAGVLDDWAWQPVGGTADGPAAAEALPIVCAQNGVANEGFALRRFRHVYGMCVWLPATHLEPGTVVSQGTPLAGLLPVAEIQFRKYADPAAEQLNDCGTLRWRTRNRFAAPLIVRMPGGFSKCGDPWHSQTNEVAWVHGIGWHVAVPSNAEDAVGLLRAALRGNDPVIFFEHRAMLDGAWARRPYPGDEYVVPFGEARTVRAGTEVSVVSWGAMVERCLQAASASHVDAEVLDLRTLSPWDKGAVRRSVEKTRRCLIVHEDNLTAGFGAEIAATLAQESFFSLDAPIERLAMPDIPSPHSPVLLEAAVPSVAQITAAIQRLASV